MFFALSNLLFFMESLNSMNAKKVDFCFARIFQFEIHAEESVDLISITVYT